VLGENAHTYEVAANWKVIAENYHECYHCPLIHPELCQVTPPTSGDNYALPGAWAGGSMDLRDGMATDVDDRRLRRCSDPRGEPPPRALPRALPEPVAVVAPGLRHDASDAPARPGPHLGRVFVVLRTAR
jgi:Rieske 2Fe-2S family protein